MVVVVGVAGAALALFAASRTWAVEVVARPAPLPDERTVRDGGDLLPWLPALGWVALAGAVVLVAVRGRWRRALGGLLAAAGAGVAAGAGWAAADASLALTWPLLGVLGGAAVATAGVLAAWRSGRWPAMGARYERPRGRGGAGGRPGRAAGAESGTGHDRQSSPEEIWDALDRGEDPTG